MSERELTLKLGAELKSGGAAALEQLGSAAKDAAAQEKKYQDLLGRRIDDYKLAFRLKEDLAKAGIGRELTAEQQYQAALKERIKSYQTAKRMKEDLARAGIRGAGGGAGAVLQQASGVAGAMGLALPISALGAFAASIKLADSAVKAYYGSMERGQFSDEAFRRSRAKEMPIPILSSMMYHHKTASEDLTREKYEEAKKGSKVGYLFGPSGYLAIQQIEQSKFGKATRGFFGIKPHASSQTFEEWRKSRGESDVEKDYKIFLAQQSIVAASQYAGLHAQRLGAEGGLGTGVFGGLADSMAALRLRQQRYGIISGATGQRAAAIAGVRGSHGYGRQEQLADVLQRIGFREQVLGIGATGAAHVAGISARQNEAELQEAVYGQRFGQARAAETAAASKLKGHIDRKGGHEEELRLRHELSAAAAARKTAEDSLMQAQKQSLDFRQQKEQAILATQEQQHAAMRQQLTNLNSVIQLEKQRQATLTENLGLMHPMHLRTALGVARKAKMGGNLTMGEIGFMQSHRDLFGSQLQQMGARRAAANPMIGELMRLTGQSGRQQSLEMQRLQLQNEINVHVKVDETSLVQQWERQVLPKFGDAVERLKHALDNRISELANQMMAQRRAMFPGAQ